MTTWSYEDAYGDLAFLLADGVRVAGPMTKARAVGIAAALNTPEGSAAFHQARDAYNAARSGQEHAR